MAIVDYKTAGSKAQGEPTSDGFIVFKGSIAVKIETPTIGASSSSLRSKLLEAGILENDGKYYRFARDHIFSFPSQASAVVLGKSSNGWTDWKSITGYTLKEI